MNEVEVLFVSETHARQRSMHETGTETAGAAGMVAEKAELQAAKLNLD